MSLNHRKLVFITILAAQAVVISFFERFLPTPFAFAPGARLGLGNLITIISLFTLPTKDSIKVVSLRLTVSTFLSGTFSTFLYAFAGTLLSFTTMLLLKQLGQKRVSVIGISVMGGVMHNMGQLLVFAMIGQSWLVLNYLPILSFSGILSGFLVGVTGNYLLLKINALKEFQHNLPDGWTI
ncbi:MULTISPECIES: Gx transporter family protein [Streptococcus]|uniref:Gx transporter family protein n=1 Tax=Streptococcus caledonicus TaxID=2614158 RepID=A0ABW0UF39_9STRE|nr:Gx transporter family protein [Streptococcus sp. S784/96/1]